MEIERRDDDRLVLKIRASELPFFGLVDPDTGGFLEFAAVYVYDDAGNLLESFEGN